MVGWPDRRFLDLVGTACPIIQAPMAGAGGVALCIAAMKGGALGSLPCALLSADLVRGQVA
jgi:nitronate monooxygenase